MGSVFAFSFAGQGWRMECGRGRMECWNIGVLEEWNVGIKEEDKF
jgi:hypothetical protein